VRNCADDGQRPEAQNHHCEPRTVGCRRGEVATRAPGIHEQTRGLGAAFAKLLHADNDHSDRNTQDQRFDQTGLTARKGEDDDGKTEDASADIRPRRPGRLIALVVIHRRQCT